jgi:hypothetical protein
MCVRARPAGANSRQQYDCPARVVYYRLLLLLLLRHASNFPTPFT